MLLLNRLAFLTQYLFASVPDPLTLVRLGRIIRPNIGGDLTNHLFVDALDQNPGVFSNRDFDSIWNRERYRMREPNIQIQIFALHLGTKSNTVNFKSFLEPLAHTDHHVVNQAARKSVKRLYSSSLVIPSQNRLLSFNTELDLLWQNPLQLALWTFHLDRTRIGNVHLYFFRNFDRFFANARHIQPPYQIRASNSPPTRSLRASLPVIIPRDVERIATPIPPSTRGISSEPTYFRSPGLLMRLRPVNAGVRFTNFIVTLICAGLLCVSTSNSEIYPSCFRMRAISSFIREYGTDTSTR